ncbi:MAG: hypothetical protein MUF78_04785 [Candidatus Edwardsbacteria bacterium]|jgi:hypothetical protein|nr:hypothetical protein [Candidatus Edwardsbacteria bacterium]
MTDGFQLVSSRPDLLSAARDAAIKYADGRIREGTIGVAFLGAIARGYFDADSDIDISFFEEHGATPCQTDTVMVDGHHVHYFRMDFGAAAGMDWDDAQRWAYSRCIIHYDPAGRLAELLGRKVPLRPEERKRSLMAGTALSEWYVNRLTDVWVRRGSLASAHHMIHEGLNHFLGALFALNNELVADHKWRLHCAEGLKVLPLGFMEGMTGVLGVGELSRAELERRKAAFMGLWRDILPAIECELGMKYDEFKDKV